METILKWQAGLTRRRAPHGGSDGIRCLLNDLLRLTLDHHAQERLGT
jgi:hypothetical protein